MHEIEAASKVLYTWTPYLAGGFVWNIVISVVALAIGLPCGYALARLRLSSRRTVSKASECITSLTRNIPTFVFQYYLIFMLPNSVSLPFVNLAMPLPSWVKAALALALAVTGFVSDNVLVPLREWRAGSRRGALLFISHLVNFFVVIVMASSTASVIGVAEIVSRCNTVINALGRTDAMLWIYLYGMAWFCVFSLITAVLLPKLFRRLVNH
ncbi:ABC transporter permease subunit [Trinickia acidisoli]|uniref:ABC transporter permease subunit n=1 Tax=Trinickia acidisoli TaxID=2767482 RepID=UPI001A8D61BE|nr:ABC transporter permease subunit [Trinickia acidisoli]